MFEVRRFRGRLVALLLGPMLAALAVLAAGGAVPASAGQGLTQPEWIATAIPLAAHAATVNTSGARVSATTCPTPGYCVAVGTNATTTGTDYVPLIEVYAGGTWAEVPLTGLIGGSLPAYGELYSVSCPAPGSCAAAGAAYGPTGDDYQYVVTLSGGTWTASEPPVPANAVTGTRATRFFNSVSCGSVGTCVAVGEYYSTASGDDVALIDQFAGGTWSNISVAHPSQIPAPTPVVADMRSVTCPSAVLCVAVGTVRNTTHRGLNPISEVLSGGAWSGTEFPELAGGAPANTSTATFTSVSCQVSETCVAVGSFNTDEDNQFESLIGTLSGGTWVQQAGPLPPGSATAGSDHMDVRLHSVSCPVSGSCVAAGSDVDLTRGGHAQVTTLSGGTWTAAEAPEPSNAGTDTDGNQEAYFTQVACSAPGWCTAVGTYREATGGYAGLIASESAGSWATQAAPVPANATVAGTVRGFLDSVSCTGGGCTAGGSYRSTVPSFQGLIETYNLAPSGYFEAASDGGIFAFTAPFHGSEGGQPLNAPIVAAVADPLTGGYYEVASDGGIFAFTAPFHGSMGGKPLNEPIVSMTFDTRTGGYYLVASDGGLFAFTAPFHGSMGGKPLNKPIVGMAFDPLTGGYWEVASDGGLFAFTAPFLGSMGGKPLNEPIVGMTYDTLTNGYYEVASDGGLFSFTAPFRGSMGGKPLNEPIVGMAFDYGTGGYWEVASDGGLFAFTAPFLGSMGGMPLNKPIVTMALG